MIELRDLLPADEERLLNWRNLPDVAQYMYTDHEITREEHGRWFASIANDATRRYWIIVLDGEDVGLVNLYDIDGANSHCFWAFYLASDSVRGRGVGSFVEYTVLQSVFEELGLNKLCCEVLGFNEPVIRMHQGFGFSQEGRFRQHITKGEERLDVIRLAILRHEWRATRPDIEARLKTKGTLT